MTAGLRLCGFFCWWLSSKSIFSLTRLLLLIPKKVKITTASQNEARSSSNQKTIFYKKSIFFIGISVGRLSISPTSIARVQCAVHLKRFRSFVSIRIVAFYSDCHVVHPRWRRACALPSAMNTIARVLPLPAFGRGRCSPTERQRLIYILLTSAGFFSTIS